MPRFFFDVHDGTFSRDEIGVELENADAARKAVWHGIGHVVVFPVHPFSTDAQQRERLAPGGCVHLTEADLDNLRIQIYNIIEAPLKKYAPNSKGQPPIVL